ncbi:LysE family transporter [Streptomyces griseoviridis]|uniref:LysE family transporter n=1 Tax=Streptomyces griseoviridis TaxID=45398 RepID=UPI0033C556CE
MPVPPRSTRERSWWRSWAGAYRQFDFGNVLRQFVDPAYAYPALSFVVLGAFAQAASFLYLSALIFSGTRLAAAFRRRRRLSATATSAAGVLFLGFAVKLTLASA